MYPPLMGLSLHSNAFCRTPSMDDASPFEGPSWLPGGPPGSAAAAAAAAAAEADAADAAARAGDAAGFMQTHDGPATAADGAATTATAAAKAAAAAAAAAGGPLDFCPAAFRVPFPDDVTSKAKEYLAAVGSVGAYSHSQGVKQLREKIAVWFEERDGFAVDPDDLFLTDGALKSCCLLFYCLLIFF